MSFSELHTPIPMTVEGKGPGQAIAVIDYGPEHHLIWVTALDASGEIWCAPNPQVRMQANWSMGRAKSPAVAASKERMASKNAGLGEACADCADRVPEAA